MRTRVGTKLVMEFPEIDAPLGSAQSAARHQCREKWFCVALSYDSEFESRLGVSSIKKRIMGYWTKVQGGTCELVV